MSNCSSPVIDEFIRQFNADRDAYEQLSSAVEKRIRTLLDQKGILALVTARVKNPKRLEQKLLNRDAERIRKGKLPYQSTADIFDDIPDLIGVRIALYFPGDTAKIGGLLSPQFTVVQTKVFPEKVESYDDLMQEGFTAYKRKIYEGYDTRRFDGYCAVHFRVRFAEQPVSSIPEITIEIQVASVLMHAWSEVEHDLAYKKMTGVVSREEFECLDEINGLVMAGEIALNRLNQLSLQRIQNTRTFDTQYALAAYLSYWMKTKNLGDRELGNVKDLFESYRLGDVLTQDYLLKQLDKLEEQKWYESSASLVEQLLELFSSHDNRTIVKKVVSHSIAEMNDSELTEAQLGRFLGRWNKLDDKIRMALRRNGHANLYRNRLNELVEKNYVLSEEFGVTYRHLRMLRNDIVHGQLTPSLGEFRQLMADIENLSAKLDA